MYALKIKQEADGENRGCVGQNKDVTSDLLSGVATSNFVNPLTGYGKLYREHFFLHVTDCEIVFEIIIKTKTDIINEATSNSDLNERRSIPKNDAACLLGYMGFDGNDIVKGLHLESEGRDKNPVTVNDYPSNIYGNMESIGFQQTINELFQDSNNHPDNIQTMHPGIVGTFPLINKTTTIPSSEETPGVKSEFIMDSDEITDEYSDNDLQLFMNSTDNQGDHSASNFTTIDSTMTNDTQSIKKERKQRKIKTIGEKQRLQCTKCDYTTLNAGHLNRHVQYKHTNERAFRCSLCKFTSVEGNDLKRHMERKHAGESSFKCYDCDYKCDRPRDLKLHVKSEHKGKQLFPCLECDRKFSSKIVLRRHLANKHSLDNQFKCSLCNFRFANDHALKKHHIAKHRDGAFKCSRCSYASTTAITLAGHIKDKHSDTTQLYECLDCDFKCPKINDLKQHILIMHTNRRVHECSLCDYKTPNASHLNRHRLYKHSNSCRITCSQCDFKCVEKHDLKKHVLRVHEKQRPYPCPVCDHSSTLSCNLRKHIRKKHPESEYVSDFIITRVPQLTDGSHKCQECNYTCSLAGDLQRHVQKHTLPFMCHMCSFRTSTAGNLKGHMLSRHTSERPFKCQECQFKTTRGSKLQTHILIKHRGQRKVLCPQCGYKCSQTSHLNRHIMAKHTGELPYKCQECEYRCNRPDNLRNHVMCKHTGERPFKCHICNYGCTRADILKRHMTSKHECLIQHMQLGVWAPVMDRETNFNLYSSKVDSDVMEPGFKIS